MINYRNYKSTDFLTDPLFRAWVLAKDPRASQFWTQWLLENKDRTEEIADARAMLYAMQEKAGVPDDAEIEQRVDNTIRLIREGSSQSAIVVPVRPWYVKYYGVAAMICLSLGLGWLSSRYFINKDEQKFGISQYYTESNGVAQYNNSKETITIVLDDSSTVTLKPNSELHYPKKFAAGRREVHLKGEAFFQITRNPNRPFVVLTDELVTEVLGTSFTVKSFEKDRSASVSVKTGRVSVYTKLERQAAKKTASKEIVGVILKPNQEVVFDKEVARLVKVIVPSPQRISNIPTTSLIFDESPVKNVFGMLENEYGIEIIANEETLSACSLTANLSGLSLYEQLDMICKIIHARYEIIDAQVVIHSNGCN